MDNEVVGGDAETATPIPASTLSSPSLFRPLLHCFFLWTMRGRLPRCCFPLICCIS